MRLIAWSVDLPMVTQRLTLRVECKTTRPLEAEPNAGEMFENGNQLFTRVLGHKGSVFRATFGRHLKSEPAKMVLWTTSGWALRTPVLPIGAALISPRG